MASDLKIEVDTAVARATADFIKTLPRNIRRQISDVLREQSKLVARDARAILKDEKPPRSRTGETARQTRHKRGRGGLSYLVETKAHPKKGPVALWLEYGTSRGGKRKTQRTHVFTTDRKGITQLRVHRRSVRFGGAQRNPPYPFITAALEKRQEAIQRALAKAIAEALDGQKYGGRSAVT